MSNNQLLRYALADCATAFSTTREGGCSQGTYASMNVGAYCGDDEASVAANRRTLVSLLGMTDEARLVVPHQVHGIESRIIGEEFPALPESIRGMILEGVDAVMTNVPGICVGVTTADCIPLLICDPSHRAVCAVHAGWRGTVAQIARKALADMAVAYGTRPEDVLVQIGPGISLENFEVGDEVYEAFAEAGFDLERVARRLEKWHIDLPLCNRLTLEDAGVRPDRIADCAVCTYAEADRFFSARRLGTASGRIYTGIMLHEEET